MPPGKLNIVKPTSEGDDDPIGVEQQPEAASAFTPDPSSKVPRKAGKQAYQFKNNYRRANICQKFFYTYGNPVVKSVNDNKGTLKMENIEDIKSNEEETAQLVQCFTSSIRKHVAAKVKGKTGIPTEEEIDIAMQSLPLAEMQELVKGALWNTFKWDWVIAATFVLVGECTGVFSCYFISFLINYLRDEQADYTEGIKLISIFGVVCIIQ